MGLPLFVAPAEPEAPAKAVEKATSGARSSIRRMPPTRRIFMARRSEIARARSTGVFGDRDPEELESSEYQPLRWPLTRTPYVLHDRDSLAAEIRGDVGASFRNPYMLGSERLAAEQTSSQTEEPTMPPAPEPRDFSELERRRRILAEDNQNLRRMRHGIRRLGRRHPAPTPPSYTENDFLHLAHGAGIDSPRLSASTTQYLQGVSASSLPQRMSDDFETNFLLAREPSSTADRSGRSNLSERVQALNRASNHLARARRLTRQARLDGLGDRDRSLSPENSTAWDTLLTSITPDPQPPSATSSFTSAVAAATSSSSGQGSAGTSMTSLDQAEDSLNPHDCDMSDSGSHSEDEEEDIYELQEFSRNRGDQFWRTYADVVSLRVGDPTLRSRSDSSRDHLEGMHRIISGLAEQDHIPDEWWASAGLSRNLRREPTN